jgi:PleD family two-component response regulator
VTPSEQNTILVVEDDVDVADMLDAYFRVQGYDVVVANYGEDALNATQHQRPDLVILDIRLPDIDGYEVARRLRGDRRTEDIPIIFLTERRERADRLQGLELGGDDYITKPFDVQELRLRVRNALRRTTQSTLTNPVTGLPEGVLVDERLEESLRGDQWVMLLVSLDHLDRFREIYGFVASDDVQRAFSVMIHNAIRSLGTPNDFIGHLSPTHYLLVVNSQQADALTERIRQRLEQSLDYFYPVKDRVPQNLPEPRLAVRMSRVTSQDGPFGGVTQLKDALLQRLA